MSPVILDNGDLVVDKELLTCTSEYSLYFQVAVFVYKGLLLIFGAFLAWQTRKVNIPDLNDSQYIGMCVYNVTVLSILGIVLLFALSQQVELQYTIVSAFIIFGTSIVQLTIFIPKVLKLYSVRNKTDSGDVGTEDTGTGKSVKTTTTTTTAVSGDGTKELLQDLTGRMELLRKELILEEPNIQKLRDIVNSTV